MTELELIKEITNITAEMCMDTGLNTAHDYDGIETREDIILYLKAIQSGIREKKFRIIPSVKGKYSI